MSFSHVHIQHILPSDFDALLQAANYSNMFAPTDADLVAVSVHEPPRNEEFMKVAICYNNMTALFSLVFFFGARVAQSRSAEKKGGGL